MTVSAKRKRRRPITDGMKLAVLRCRVVLVACDSCHYSIPLRSIEFDHHLALVDGGKHTVENIRPLCGVCHAAKSAREHIANCKAKRLASGGRKRKGPPMRSRGFSKTLTKKFSGEVVRK